MTPDSVGGQGDPACVLACVDASGYANSVCDHAGWFASDPDVGVEVFRVLEPGCEFAPTAPILERGVSRLRDEGVGPVTSFSAAGSLVEQVAQHRAGLIVIGKRGELSEAECGRLGSNVDALVRHIDRPICLAPKVFLPIQRLLILMDANPAHRAALEFAVADFRLAGLPTDLLITAGPDETAEAKIQWARARLTRGDAQVFSLVAEGLDDAVLRYMHSRAADMVVISRAVLAADPQGHLRRMEERTLWGLRTPVLIC